jgi:hypothetical protein
LEKLFLSLESFPFLNWLKLIFFNIESNTVAALQAFADLDWIEHWLILNIFGLSLE